MSAQLVVRDPNGNFFSIDPEDHPQPNSEATLLFSTGSDGLCAQLTGNNMKKSTFYVDLFVAAADDQVGVVPGTYNMGDDSVDGGITLTSSDATGCGEKGTRTPLSVTSSSGTVVITQVGSRSSPTTGTINLTLNDGRGSFVGDFSASPCALSSLGEATSCD